MGVFTVGRQVALEIDMPGWWLANAAVDMDFRRGLYYDSSTANPRAVTDFLSCVRASVGYAKTAEGTLTSFASNALRITSAGLLCEDARTNVVLRSQELNNATNWNQTGAASLTADAAVAPDGTTTADKLVEDSANDIHRTGQTSIAFTAGTISRTWSVYAKAAGRTQFQILVYNGSTQVAYRYDLVAVTATQTDTSGDYTAQSTAIETLASGWFRCSLTCTSAASAASFYLYLNDSNNQTYLGNGSSGVYFWGAQIEETSFASSYIPTTSATATRAAENITTSGSLQTAINAATGSLVAQTDNGGAAGFAANIVDSNGTNLLGFDATNHALASMTATLATGNTANRTTQDKLGLAWTASARSLVLNGGTVANDASSQTPSATQHIGSTGTANFAYAYVERLSAWTTKLADATLQGFTV